jgi:hypothetical protein
LRSSLIIALVLASAPSAWAQVEDEPVDPIPDPAETAAPPADEVTPPPDEVTPTETPLPPSTDRGDRELFKNRGVVLGLELGFGGASGTPATIYGSGVGTGLIVGYRQDRFAVEFHLLQRYALSTKDDALRGETTLGKMSTTSALLHYAVLESPVTISVMAGPSFLSVPIYVVTTSDTGATTGDQLIEARSMRGLGLIAGASAGIAITPRVGLALDVRKVLAATWEMPSLAYVVPGMRTADGKVMYMTSTEDATSSMWTATLVARVLL